MLVAAAPDATTADRDALDWSDGRLPTDQQLLLELGSHPALQLLELHSNSLGCAGVNALVQALRSPGCAGSLRYLGLARNAISEAGGCSIAAWLATASIPLQTLDLQDNSLGDRAATAFASMLHRNRQLQVISLMRSVHARPARSALLSQSEYSCHAALLPQHLSLLHNAIGRRGALALAESLGENRTLATLDLRLNLIDEHELQVQRMPTAVRASALRPTPSVHPPQAIMQQRRRSASIGPARHAPSYDAGERETDNPTSSPAGALSLGVKRAETLLEAARAVLGHTQDEHHAEQASVRVLPSQLQRSLDDMANDSRLDLADRSSWLQEPLPSDDTPRASRDASSGARRATADIASRIRDAAGSDELSGLSDEPLPTDAARAARAWLEEQSRDECWRQTRGALRPDEQPRVPPSLAAPRQTPEARLCFGTTAGSPSKPAYSAGCGDTREFQSLDLCSQDLESSSASLPLGASEAACDALLDQLDLEAQSVSCGQPSQRIVVVARSNHPTAYTSASANALQVQLCEVHEGLRLALLELRALPVDTLQLADAVLARRLPCSLEQLDHSLQSVHDEAARQHDLMEATVLAVEQVEADSRAVHAALRDEQSAREQMELAATERLAEAEETIRRLEGEAVEARDAAARSMREAHTVQLQAADRLAASAQLQQEQAARHAEQLQAVVRAAREQELVAVEAALNDLSAGLRRLCGQLLPRSQAEDVLAARVGVAGSALAPGLEPSVALARQALSCLERLEAAQLPAKSALHEIQAQLEQEQQVCLL